MLLFQVFDLMGREDSEDCSDMSQWVVDQRVGVVFQVTFGGRGRLYNRQILSRKHPEIQFIRHIVIHVWVV